MTEEEIKTAQDWYVNKGYDLITIAQHFDVSVWFLKSKIRKGV